MPELILGPLVRHVGKRDATVWVETDEACEPSQMRTLDPEGELRVSFGLLPGRAAAGTTIRLDQGRARGRSRGRRAPRLRARAASRPRQALAQPAVDDRRSGYVDAGSPETREFIRSRRDVSEPPGEEVSDFEEYTRLYRESWSEPYVRWLFSTVPTGMVIDDHDISDDWNISRSGSRRWTASPGGTGACGRAS
jgi:hypothetical protein